MIHDASFKEVPTLGILIFVGEVDEALPSCGSLTASVPRRRSRPRDTPLHSTAKTRGIWGFLHGMCLCMQLVYWHWILRVLSQGHVRSHVER